MTLRLAIICGGPSVERGISLNSGRSLMDHLRPLGYDLLPIYCDTQKQFFQLNEAQVYSNTPSDFDFKLAATAQPMDKAQLIKLLRNVDLVFPAIHGAFGEDGELQSWLEENNIPFVGSPSCACRKMFDKGTANRILAQHGFATLPNCLVEETDSQDKRERKLTDFFKKNHIEKAVLKPSAGGSSLGVATAHSVAEALNEAHTLFTSGHGPTALVEPFCQGQEFTVVVLEGQEGKPVALIPTEIELTSDESSIFTFRHKYLPTCHVSYHCPPRFSDDTVDHIQKAAEVLFSFFGMRDFARLDGWLFDDGSILFSDFNPISGMEQNSFLFIQGSRVGMSHSEILAHVVSSAARRCNLSAQSSRPVKNSPTQKVHVLFGGETAERQVSLMSGTNVWLKLLHHPAYDPEPYLLSLDGDVWKLPYPFTLKHTVEEILFHCKNASSIAERLEKLVPPLRKRLGLPVCDPERLAKPERMTLDAFCERSKKDKAFVFIGLHGGMGEDGRLQSILDRHGLAYNGSGPKASDTGADKNKTGNIINGLLDSKLVAAPKVCFAFSETKDDVAWLDAFWEKATTTLQSPNLLIKPQNDGCSTGVVRLFCAEDLGKFLAALRRGDRLLFPGTLNHQTSTIELSAQPDLLMLEPFIITDNIVINDKKLSHNKRTGWIELTVGVLEHQGRYHALTPSITVAEGNVLSLEEKFQGGTGINLTPPPSSIMSDDQINLVRKQVEKAAQALGIGGYARLDLFFNTESEKTLLIEANTLPGLTAATVIFHQAFAEKPPLCPQAFLALLIERSLSAKGSTP